MSLQSIEWQAWVWHNIPPASVVMYLGWHPWRCHSLPMSLVVGSSRQFLPWPLFSFLSAVVLSELDVSLQLGCPHCVISEIFVPFFMPHCGGGSGNFESFFKVYLTRHCTYSLYAGCFRMTVHGVRKRAREEIRVKETVLHHIFLKGSS